MFTQYSTAQRQAQTASANQNAEPTECRIRAKVRARAILIGQTKPAPLILIDATRAGGNA